MNTTLIQLSEENSIDNKSINKINGQWHNTMTDTNITLENGDVLSIKNAFIDSAPSGNIFLANDTTAKIQFNYYFMNHDDFPSDTTLPAGMLKKRTYAVPDTYQTVGAIRQPDGVAYIACKKTGGGTTVTIDTIQFNSYGNDSPNDRMVFTITVKGTGDKFLPCGEGTAATKVTVPYPPTPGKVISASLALSATQASNLYLGGGAGPLANYDNIKIVRDDGHVLNPKEDIIIERGEFTHDSKLTPIENEVSINLKKGYYSPAHIAHLMNDQLNVANSSSNPQGEYLENQGINSPLYTTINNLIETVGGIANLAFSAMDGSNTCTFTPNLADADIAEYDMFIGSNTFTFDYRDDLGIPRMAISQNHSPIYQKALTGIKKIEYSKRTIENGVNVDKNFTRLIGATSGVLPIGITAEGSDFWDLIGFSQQQFNPPFTQKNVIINGQNVFMNVFDLTKIKEHITSTYAGLDILISKDDNDPANYTNYGTIPPTVSTNYTNNQWTPPVLPNDKNINDFTLNKAEKGSEKNVGELHNNTFISTTNISPIFADYPIERALEQINPYYLININVMKNNAVSSFGENTSVVSQKFADISAVIGTYYNSSSYTLSQPSDSIPYVHKGNPIPLNNITVRILDKNKNNNKACLDKSHVFLLLEKANQEKK